MLVSLEGERRKGRGDLLVGVCGRAVLLISWPEKEGKEEVRDKGTPQ